MHTVDSMIEDILRREGGFVNHPNDRGGATNYGITIGTLSGWLGRKATVLDVKILKRGTAKHIYETNYYYSPAINRVDDELEPILFDMSINHGPRRAIKILQGTTRKAGYITSVDGAIGPQTIKTSSQAVNKMDGYFINAIVEDRMRFYHAIVRNNPSQKVFIKGWLRRAKEFLVPERDENIAQQFAEHLMGFPEWAS